MIGNKLEQSIIGVFQNDISSTFSINQVSKILNKSYPLINKKSNFFLQEGILKKINIGKSYQCFLNMQSEKARVLMAMNELNKKESYTQKNREFGSVLEEILQLAKKYPIDSVVLYKRTLIFIMSHQEKNSEIIELSFLTKDYNLLFFSRKEFQDLFIKDKDLQRYHMVLFNVDIYFNIISEISEKILTMELISKKDDGRIGSVKEKNRTKE